MNTYIPPVYPLCAFHQVARDAALEVQRHVQASDALVGMTLLGVMSASCQGLIDVKLPTTGQIRPVSLNLLVLAESGERKSTVESIICAPLYAQDVRSDEQFKAAFSSYQSDFDCWRSVNKGICRRISKSAQTGHSIDELQKVLEEHAKNTPTPPRLRRLIRQNITERSIMEALQGDGESVSFTTDEGQLILKGGAMNHLGLLNKVWDGAQLLTLDRADMKNITVRNPRATVSIMAQTAVLRAFLVRNGEVAKGSGHWARYLIGQPTSMKGYRHVYNSEPEWVHLPGFHSRVIKLLEEYNDLIEAGNVRRKVIEFSVEAKVRWIEMANDAELQIRPGHYLSDINDFASKFMEIISRVAALLHHFSEQEGKITVDTLERAFGIVSWHLDEFKRLFSEQFVIPQVQVDMQALAKHLHKHYWKGPGSFVARNDILHNGPVRLGPRFHAALNMLEVQGAICITHDKSKKRFINLNPQFFSSTYQ